jgi:hypothetical protein
VEALFIFPSVATSSAEQLTDGTEGELTSGSKGIPKLIAAFLKLERRSDQVVHGSAASSLSKDIIGEIQKRLILPWPERQLRFKIDLWWKEKGLFTIFAPKIGTGLIERILGFDKVRQHIRVAPVGVTQVSPTIIVSRYTASI